MTTAPPRCSYYEVKRGQCQLAAHPPTQPHTFSAAVDVDDRRLGDHPAEDRRVVFTDEDVNHPGHYGGADNQHEAIKVIEAWLTAEQASGFRLGNSLKYLSRAGKKDDDGLRDLRKAAWYLEREIEKRS